MAGGLSEAVLLQNSVTDSLSEATLILLIQNSAVVYMKQPQYCHKTLTGGLGEAT